MFQVAGFSSFPAFGLRSSLHFAFSILRVRISYFSEFSGLPVFKFSIFHALKQPRRGGVDEGRERGGKEGNGGGECVGVCEKDGVWGRER